MEIENVSDLDITAPPAEKLIGESILLSSDVVYQNALINRPE
jgi:outer membrane protein